MIEQGRGAEHEAASLAARGMGEVVVAERRLLETVAVLAGELDHRAEVDLLAGAERPRGDDAAALARQDADPHGAQVHGLASAGCPLPRSFR